jgi:hypothetical protein
LTLARSLFTVHGHNRRVKPPAPQKAPGSPSGTAASSLFNSVIIDLLDYIAALGKNASLEHWHKDAHAAGLLAGALRNRQDNV